MFIRIQVHKKVFKRLFSTVMLGHLMYPQQTQAQIMPDQTLGPNLSRVTTVDSNIKIEGGTQRGENLFHSFQKFNILEGQTVLFDNPQGIKTIFSRVTAREPSYLYGTLGVDGPANLYFLNPAGIIFGPDAQLHISGSFVASTANALTFGENATFSAVNPQAPPLLEVNVPVGLQFGDGLAANIYNSGFLEVGQDLNFSAGNIEILGALLVGGTAILDSQESILVDGVLEVNQDLALSTGNIEITGALIAGGNATLKAQDLILINGEFGGGLVIVDTLQSEQPRGINIDAERLLIIHGGLISTNTGIDVDGGNINVRTTTLRLSDGAGLESITFGPGDTGNISVNTSSLQLDDGSFIRLLSEMEASGNVGNITIDASNFIQLFEGRESIDVTIGEEDFGQIRFEDPLTEIVIESLGSGQAGQLDINTSSLFIRGEVPVLGQETAAPASIRLVNVNSSDPGQLIINSTESITLIEGTLSTETQGSGNAGALTVHTSRLRLKDGAQISTNTIGKGSGGRLTVSASDIQIIETRENIRSPASLLASTIGPGDAGELIVHTERLHIQGGAQITSSSTVDLPDSPNPINNNEQAEMASRSNLGNGGQLEIEASQEILIVGNTTRAINDPEPIIRSGIFAVTEGPGEAGTLTIRTPQLQVIDQAIISAENRGDGVGGRLDIKANLITLDSQASIVSTTNSLAGGDINLTVAGSLLLRNNSFISTNAEASFGSGNGGNIFIDANVVIALPNENSDITTEASLGDGGRIQINTQGLFGFALDNQSPSLSGISANSAFGTDGQIEISSFNNPVPGLVSLPGVLATPAPLQHCQYAESIKGSQFVSRLERTPPGPKDIGQHNIWEDLRPVETKSVVIGQGPNYSLRDDVENVSSLPIIEAQGWRRTANGNYVLTEQASTAILTSQEPVAKVCHQL